MQNKSTFIFGYSGHAYVILDSLLSLGEPVGGYFTDSEAEKNPYGIVYAGSEKSDHAEGVVGENFVFPGVGSNTVRKKMISFFIDYGLNQRSVIDPSALISAHALIKLSTYVGRNAVVNALAVINEGVIINTAAIVEHECVIGDFTHIAPNATLAGNVRVGERSFVGAGAVVKPGIRIGSNVTVGAGSVIIRDIPDNEIWAGCPAKFIRHAS